ncbi:hypothetical protein GCM10018791_55990 [Streptomyces zaomyceticus]|nr:hypothetical protein GCM10018791_55990 [Streptomyces zaomyceticus]
MVPVVLGVLVVVPGVLEEDAVTSCFPLGIRAVETADRSSDHGRGGTGFPGPRALLDTAGPTDRQSQM